MATSNDQHWFIGLMSGTSMDGVDAALIRTDGETVTEFGGCLTIPYDEAFRERLRAILGLTRGSDVISAVERDLTAFHCQAVRQLLAQENLAARDIQAIGFHGHTIAHDPAVRFTWQIGDGERLARETGIDVVYDFRTNDVAAGGEGAPLVPIFHKALADHLPKPVCFLNVGGVANVTFIGSDGELVAFDTGPGNALIDDFLLARTGHGVDLDGATAAHGRVNSGILGRLMDNAYFDRKPPKSLDRGSLSGEAVSLLSTEDGAATLTAFTVEAVYRGKYHLPEEVSQWLVCGGGRHNKTLMQRLRERLQADVVPVEDHGMDGDALEAQAFGFLAARTRRQLPITFPKTTGAPRPLTGGRLAKAEKP